MKFYKLDSINFLMTLSDVAHHWFHDGSSVTLPSHHRTIASRGRFSSKSQAADPRQSRGLCVCCFAVHVSRGIPLSFVTTSGTRPFLPASFHTVHSRRSFAWQIRVVVNRIEIHGSYFLEPRGPCVCNKGRPVDVMGDGRAEGGTDNISPVSTQEWTVTFPASFWIQPIRYHYYVFLILFSNTYSIIVVC